MADNETDLAAESVTSQPPVSVVICCHHNAAADNETPSQEGKKGF